MEHDTEFTYFKTTDVVRSAITELSGGPRRILSGSIQRVQIIETTPQMKVT